jgi:hypothetical protein
MPGIETSFASIPINAREIAPSASEINGYAMP